MRLLILDFDFFSSIGGGQTFYRRIVERHPSTEVWYPSRGPDVRAAARGELPPNAHPFAFDPFCDINGRASYRALNPKDEIKAIELARIAIAVQANIFDAVEVPSFFPIAHLIRPVLASYGIVVRRVSIGLLGWLSVSLKKSYAGEQPGELENIIVDWETRSVAAADVLYTISELHAAENLHHGEVSGIVDIHDAIEEFPTPPAHPPGAGPPDLWYIGRMDRAKGPDLFVEIAAKVPRHLFGRCRLAGPDNRGWSAGPSWSQLVEEKARELGLDASYVGLLSDADLRREVYAGRTVLVIPSRTDAFNYVSVEALMNGCLILLSKHAGAAEFLAKRHPTKCPPIIDPEDVEASAREVTLMLKQYEKRSTRLRKALARSPFPKPKRDFMLPFYKPDRQPKQRTIMATPAPLLRPSAALWRPTRERPGRPARVAAVVLVRDAPAWLAATLSSLQRQTFADIEIYVMDDGSTDPRLVREVVASFDPKPQLSRTGPQGYFWAANRAWQLTQAESVSFYVAGDIVDPELLSRAVSAMEDPENAAFIPRWVPMLADGAPAESAARFPSETLTMPDEEPWPDVGCGLILRLKCLHEAGGFDVSLQHWASVDLLMRLPRSSCIARDPGDRIGVWHPVAANWFAQTATSLDKSLFERLCVKHKRRVLEPEARQLKQTAG